MAVQRLCFIVSHPLWSHLPPELCDTLLSVDAENYNDVAQSTLGGEKPLTEEEYFVVLAFYCYFAGSSEGPLPKVNDDNEDAWILLYTLAWLSTYSGGSYVLERVAAVLLDLYYIDAPTVLHDFTSTAPARSN